MQYGCPYIHCLVMLLLPLSNPDAGQTQQQQQHMGPDSFDPPSKRKPDCVLSTVHTVQHSYVHGMEVCRRRHHPRSLLMPPSQMPHLVLVTTMRTHRSQLVSMSWSPALPHKPPHRSRPLEVDRQTWVAETWSSERAEPKKSFFQGSRAGVLFGASSRASG